MCTRRFMSSAECIDCDAVSRKFPHVSPPTHSLTTVPMTMRSLARHFSMIRGTSGADTSPSFPHDRQARFSVFVTNAKYFAGLGADNLFCSHPGTSTQTPPVEQVCWSDAYVLPKVVGAKE
jgi:hypothetical protein